MTPRCRRRHSLRTALPSGHQCVRHDDRWQGPGQARRIVVRKAVFRKVVVRNVVDRKASVADIAGQPVEYTSARIMAVIRAGEAFVYIPVAIITANLPASAAWLTAALLTFGLWSIVFVRTALTRGLVPW